MANSISYEVPIRQAEEAASSDTLVGQPRRLKFLDSLMVVLAVVALVCAIAHPKDSTKPAGPRIAAEAANPARNFLPDPQRQFSQNILPRGQTN